MAGSMSLPPTQDFEYYVGDTGGFSIDIANPDNTPYDMTGFTAKFVIADRPSLTPGWSILGDAQIVGSSIFCTVLPAVGNQFGNRQKVYYDVEITDGTLVQTILRGSINLTIGVNEVI